jgi:ribosomal protein S18 acetylase RimI-like enzyme
MKYRKAKSNEAEAIANIHAQSWQVAYRGILTDAFLDHEVLENRLKIWTERFSHPAKNEFICVAVEKQVLKGFVCMYGNDDAQWGTLVDNLHVSPELKGQGIGKRLMQEAAKWVSKKYPNSGLYLWVYEDNHEARRFYEKMGGKNVESQIYDNADGGSANTLRYAWTDIGKLLV